MHALFIQTVYWYNYRTTGLRMIDAERGVAIWEVADSILSLQKKYKAARRMEDFVSHSFVIFVIL